MSSEIIVKSLSPEEEKGLKICSWPIWEKEVSSFPWEYDSDEECLIIEGRVRVTPEGGEPVEFGAGDFVFFPAKMRCRWEVLEPLRKYYRFP